jgi:hypothetical protein
MFWIEKNSVYSPKQEIWPKTTAVETYFAGWPKLFRNLFQFFFITYNFAPDPKLWDQSELPVKYEKSCSKQSSVETA